MRCLHATQNSSAGKVVKNVSFVLSIKKTSYWKFTLGQKENKTVNTTHVTGLKIWIAHLLVLVLIFFEFQSEMCFVYD